MQEASRPLAQWSSNLTESQRLEIIDISCDPNRSYSYWVLTTCQALAKHMTSRLF